MAKYRAFISYKHVASTRFAENLELAIKAYAKPLLRPPIAIFRDEKYLRPGADLPSMIQEALAESEFLIYLASPEAAISTWVRCELRHWCADDTRLDRLIIVLTSGVIATAGANQTVDWDRTNALPRELDNRLVRIPFYVDLSWASSEVQQSLLNPDFKKAINLIVAALRATDPIELSGQEILQHRRNIRLRNGALAVIGGLATLFGAAAWLAWQQKLNAERQTVIANQQRELAVQRARDANARRLAGEIVRIAEDRPDVALLLAVNAFRMGDNAALRSAWWRLLGARPDAAIHLPVNASGMRFEADGSLMLETAAGTARFEERGGRWSRSEVIPSSDVLSATADWTWSGGCEQDECIEEAAPTWECARSTPRIIGPYGDQDSFCTHSRIKPQNWCGGTAIEVPGFEVRLERFRQWLRVSTGRGAALYSCATGAPLLIAGDPPFFESIPQKDAAAAGAGAPASRFAISFDRRWLALTRGAGAVELWPVIQPGSIPARRGVTRLELPANAEAVTTALSGALAIAVASTDSAKRGDVLFWHDHRRALERKPADRRIPGVWRRRGNYGILVLSSDGRHLAVGSDVRISVVETGSAREIYQSYLGRNVAIRASLSGTADYLFVVPRPLDGALNDEAWAFSRQHVQPVRFGSKVNAVVVHPARADAAITGGAAGLQIWTAPWRTPVDRLEEYPVDMFVLDAKGRTLAAGLSDRRVLVRDLDRAAKMISDRRRYPAKGLAFLDSGRVVLWASEGGLESWDWADDAWSMLDGNAHEDVQPLASSRVVALSTGSAVIYDLSPDRWIEWSCDSVRRNLNMTEWRRFVGEAFDYECACPAFAPGKGAGLAACPAAQKK